MKLANLLLGLDIGTSAVKAVLLEAKGDVLGSVSVDYPLSSPQPGWSEQNPEDMWEAAVKACRTVIKKHSVLPESILAVGLSGQMHSAIFLDQNQKVIRPAILWNDIRTGDQCRLIERTLGADLLRLEVCNPVLEGFTLPKVLWLKEHEPDNYARLHSLVLPKDYIRLRLTGNLHMEISDAAGTLMMNVRQGKWSKPVLEALQIDEAILPPIVQSAEITGTISSAVAGLTGLHQGTPVVGGGADNACGAIGSGVVSPGRGMVSIGTSGVILAHLAQPKLVAEGTVHMFNSCLPGEFYMMGVMLSAGHSLNWLRNLLASGQGFAEFTDQAAPVPPGSRGLLFLPYLTGERTPHGDANARGSFVGLSSTHGAPELVRAVLEGVAFGFRDSVELLRQAGWNGTALRALGGGARSTLWKQIIAGATGLTLEEINIDEGPALGAAILAGVGAGVYDNAAEAADSIIRVESSVEPNPAWQQAYDEMYQIYRGLYPALKPSFDLLGEYS